MGVRPYQLVGLGAVAADYTPSDMASNQALACALLSTCALACGGGEPEPRHVANLLARRADQLLDEPGELAGAALVRLGWRALEEEGEPFVAALRERVVQPLPVRHAPAEGDRELLVRLRAAPAETDDAEPMRVRIALGDEQLGEVALGARWREWRAVVPAAAWRVGDNELVFESSSLGLSGGEPRGVAVQRIRYGAPRLARGDLEARRLTLAPSTGARYLLENAGGGELAIGARADGAGELVLHFGALDAATGALALLPGAPTRLSVTSALDASVPLPDPGDRVLSVVLVWESEHGELAVDRLDASLAGPPPPPIVFISIDTLAAKHLSAYGYARETSPELDRLAAEAVRFERCITNGPWTLSSYMAQLAGLYSFSFRTSLESAPEEAWATWRLASGRWTLPEALRANGYRTAGWVDVNWLAEDFGCDQGFDHYDRDAASVKPEDPDGGIRIAAPRVLDWLDALRPGDVPFVFLHAFDVHGPYEADPSVAGIFAGDALDEGDAETRPVAKMPRLYGMIPSYIGRYLGFPDEHPIGPLARAYDEEIRALDADLGRLFDALRERGIWDEAIVVVSADHGESMREHDWYFSHGVLYDEVLHVPLFVKLPGSESGGSVVSRGVQLVDLYPTLGELAGVPARPYLHGASLVPALRGEELPERALLAEGGMRHGAALHLGKWKLLETHLEHAVAGSVMTHPRSREWLGRRAGLDEPMEVTAIADALLDGPGMRRLYDELLEAVKGPDLELYDLEADPLEREDLSEEHPDVVARLLEVMRAEQARREDARLLFRGVEGGWTPSPRELEDLGALGYFGGY